MLKVEDNLYEILRPSRRDALKAIFDFINNNESPFIVSGKVTIKLADNGWLGSIEVYESQNE